MDIKVNIHDYITEVVDLDITDNIGNRLQTTCKKDEINKVLHESMLILNDIQNDIIYNLANGCIVADSITSNVLIENDMK